MAAVGGENGTRGARDGGARASQSSRPRVMAVRRQSVVCEGAGVEEGDPVAGLGKRLGADVRRRNRGLTIGTRDWTDGTDWNWTGYGGDLKTMAMANERMRRAFQRPTAGRGYSECDGSGWCWASYFMAGGG
jgi:hypothetical protein